MKKSPLLTVHASIGAVFLGLFACLGNRIMKEKQCLSTRCQHIRLGEVTLIGTFIILASCSQNQNGMAVKEYVISSNELNTMRQLIRDDSSTLSDLIEKIGYGEYEGGDPCDILFAGYVYYERDGYSSDINSMTIHAISSAISAYHRESSKNEYNRNNEALECSKIIMISALTYEPYHYGFRDMVLQYLSLEKNYPVDDKFKSRLELICNEDPSEQIRDMACAAIDGLR